MTPLRQLISTPLPQTPEEFSWLRRDVSDSLDTESAREVLNQDEIAQLRHLISILDSDLLFKHLHENDNRAPSAVLQDNLAILFDTEDTSHTMLGGQKPGP